MLKLLFTEFIFYYFDVIIYISLRLEMSSNNSPYYYGPSHEPAGGYQYATPKYKLYPEPGNQEFNTNFEFEQPNREFTHNNQVPYFTSTSTQPLDHEFDKYYELYVGEGEIKRGFFKTEQQPLFEPRKDHQPNYNNEYEHIYDQREIYERTDPNNWHNFERPKGTRIFVGQGVDPAFRKDVFDPDAEYSYESCPSYDWYRVQELDYEERNNKTRPNFDVTKQVSAGSRPIGHSGLNRFMLSDVKNPRTFSVQDDMLMITDGKYQKDRSRPEVDYRNPTNRTDYSHKNYQAPLGSGPSGNNTNGIVFPKFRQTHRQTGDINGGNGNLTGANRGTNYDRENPLKQNNIRSQREGFQRNGRSGNFAPEVDFPSLPIDSDGLTIRQRTLIKENNMRMHAAGLSKLDNMPRGYYNDPNHVPKFTKRGDLINRDQHQQLDGLREKQYYDNPSFVPDPTKKDYFIRHPNPGMIDGKNNKMYYHDPSQVPDETKKQMLIGKGRVTSVHGYDRNIIYDEGGITDGLLRDNNRMDFIHNKYGGLLTTDVNGQTILDPNTIYVKDSDRHNASMAIGKRGTNIEAVHELTPIIDSNNPDVIRLTRKQAMPMTDMTMVNGNYRKHRILDINPIKETRKQNTHSFTPGAGANIASDPHYYDQRTLTHDAKKYAQGYQFTASGVKQFGHNNNTPNHNLKENYVDHREMENRNKVNPNGASQYANQHISSVESINTRKNNKLPELNPRCISVN